LLYNITTKALVLERLCMCVCVCVCVNVYIYVYIYIYICMYTYMYILGRGYVLQDRFCSVQVVLFSLQISPAIRGLFSGKEMLSLFEMASVVSSDFA